MEKAPKRRVARFGESSEPETKKRKGSNDFDKDEFTDLVAKMKEDASEGGKKYGKRLKAALSDETKIRKFVTNRQNLEALVSVFAKQTSLLGSELYDSQLHQCSISIIANCCYSVPSTGFSIRKANKDFLDLSVRIFESTKVDSETRSSLCRLIGNLCSNKELVTSWISSNNIIFDRVALLLESSDDKIVKQCLRIFTNLAVVSFSRVIMLSNGGFYLGKLLTKPEIRDDVVKILKILLKRHAKVLDRQLSSSNCTENIIDIFFEKKDKNRQFVIDLFTLTVCVREQMETESFIEKLLETEIAEKYRMMAAFSQTAWGRAKLRTSGALDVLIEKFSTSESKEEKLAIVTSFRHFVHDTAGMRHLSENIVFVNTVVRDVNRYVADYKSECRPSVDLDFVKSLSTKLEELTGDGNGTSSDHKSNTPSARLHKDFYSMWSYDTPQTSPRRIASASVSPSYFSPSPSYSFPSSTQSSGASSPSSDRRNDGILDDLSDIESEHGDMNKNEDDEKDPIDKMEKSIVEGELWLLTWQSQDDNNLQFLVRSDIVDCVISYLRNTANPEFRTYRVLRRMATLRTHAYHLIDMQFHIRILTGLCASPCRMLKYSKQCKQCDSRSEHGREILREFASHVDNSYGDAHINSQFEKDDFLNKTKAAIAKIVLVKERIRLAKIPALDELFESLAHILSSMELFREFGELTTYENGPSLCSQIIGALSILMSGQRIRELCESDSWYFPVSVGEGKCCLENLEELGSDSELLNFLDENDEIIATAPKEKICENSDCFRAMYSSEFYEKTEGISNFKLDSGTFSRDAFRVFIHLFSSCNSSCTTIQSAEQCASLLQLSDMYLCLDISQMLCSDDGPLRTFLNGESLAVLLPVALTTNAHPTLLNTVFLTLVRFTSNEDVTRALESICMNPTMVSNFVEKLRKFLM